MRDNKLTKNQVKTVSPITPGLRLDLLKITTEVNRDDDD